MMLQLLIFLFTQKAASNRLLCFYTLAYSAFES